MELDKELFDANIDNAEKRLYNRTVKITSKF